MSDAVGHDVVLSGDEKSSAELLEQARSLAGQGMPLIWSTANAETWEEKRDLLQAVLNSEQLADHLGKTLKLRHFITQPTTMIDQTTGEERDILRIILLTTDGKAYAASSDGLFKALQNVTAMMGHPQDWPDEGLAIQVRKVKGRRGDFFTVKLT